MISVITCTNRPENINIVFNNYERQICEKKELIIILNSDDMDLNYWRQVAKKYSKVSVYQLPRISVGKCYNFAITKAKYDYIAKFDDDDYYAPYYLSEIMKAFKKTKADLVGKSKFYAYIEKYKSFVIRNGGVHENKFVNLVADPTLAVKKSVFKKVKWPDITGGGDRIFQLECFQKGYKIYSTSKYNFAYTRGSSEKHTWVISEEEFLKMFKIICYTDDYHKMVIKEYVHNGD